MVSPGLRPAEPPATSDAVPPHPEPAAQHVPDVQAQPLPLPDTHSETAAPDAVPAAAPAAAPPIPKHAKQLSSKQAIEPILPPLAPDAAVQTQQPAIEIKNENGAAQKPARRELSGKLAHQGGRAESSDPPDEKAFMPARPLAEEESEASITAASIRQAKQALGLLPPSVHVPEASPPVREKSEPPMREPQVRIGTIEVIVESAPITQRSPSPNTGFTRDLGRYYQRRL